MSDSNGVVIMELGLRRCDLQRTIQLSKAQDGATHSNYTFIITVQSLSEEMYVPDSPIPQEWVITTDRLFETGPENVLLFPEFIFSTEHNPVVVVFGPFNGTLFKTWFNVTVHTYERPQIARFGTKLYPPNPVPPNSTSAPLHQVVLTDSDANFTLHQIMMHHVLSSHYHEQWYADVKFSRGQIDSTLEKVPAGLRTMLDTFINRIINTTTVIKCNHLYCLALKKMGQAHLQSDSRLS
ncbi:unnamed protein product [Echinostoma caproni]|uniref:PITH domain-containing protein n=1 Tax=Echinostoma caproni TaxID=27848 RepID=A0A183AEU7_9TREM|nr:unnamed protein product [Echinostoma caproni]